MPPKGIYHHLLRCIPRDPEGVNRLVVRAKSAAEARELAAAETAQAIWGQTEHTFISTISTEGEPGVILLD